MFDFFVDIWQSVLSFFGFIEFYIVNFVDYIDDGVQLIMRYGTYLTFWIAEQAVVVAFDITTEFLQSFDYSNKVNSAWSQIPSAPRQILSFLKVPECVNLVVAALGTRFTLKFVPFI
tara:strand:- start:13497 stop:13847 length:351 start_codon:yes stop_codon:yes gene_type:complete